MVGTCTALHLAMRGHQVTLVDRRNPGLETSYGNGGLIQREAVEPYPFPRDIATLLRVAAGRGADVHYHLAALPWVVGPLFQYWRNSSHARYAAVSRAYANLIVQGQTEHEALMALAGAGDLVRKQGYLSVFRRPETLAAAVKRAERLEDEAGVHHVLLDASSLQRLEPGLRRTTAGAIHWTQTWSVSDPGELVRRYASLLERKGGRCVLGDANSLQATASGWRVETADEPVEAPQVVVALGPWSSALIGKLGYRFPLFIKRGYHQHFTGGEGPNLPVLDADRGYLLAPMRRGVRLTTGAEFARLNARATPIQLGRAKVLARQLFDLGEPVEDEPWIGARPCSADMLPVIGAAPRHRGLWFNFGHGHQGFTLGPLSGSLLADLFDGRQTLVDMRPYHAERFR
ncbi:D-amino-acid dehydrogenase [Cupriavidus taiwanensis]|nr:D-amino-acid dehydrogenase [Cupriavidus taiwanensis]SOY96417.1 D-amino-acid dehydrogenase [Cupriavidus taiwanensis]